MLQQFVRPPKLIGIPGRLNLTVYGHGSCVPIQKPESHPGLDWIGNPAGDGRSLSLTDGAGQKAHATLVGGDRAQGSSGTGGSLYL